MNKNEIKNTFGASAVAAYNTYAFSWSALAINEIGLSNASGDAASVENILAFINVTLCFCSELLFGFSCYLLTTWWERTRFKFLRKTIGAPCLRITISCVRF